MRKAQFHLLFNSKKSAVIIVRNTFVKYFSYPSVVMNGESIKAVPFVKYLGHIKLRSDRLMPDNHVG